MQMTYNSHYYENTPTSYFESGGHYYTGSPPYTSIGISIATGNVAPGSEFTLYGLA